MVEDIKYMYNYVVQPFEDKSVLNATVVVVLAAIGRSM